LAVAEWWSGVGKEIEARLAALFSRAAGAGGEEEEL
jgi:hypothetical protein